MKILIIGNGFDLAHGLPTKYTDFLECSQKYLIHYDRPEFNGVFGKYVEDALNRCNLHDEFCEFSENVWLKYLLDRYDNNRLLGDTWIDFEREVRNVVAELERAYSAGDSFGWVCSDSFPYDFFVKKFNEVYTEKPLTEEKHAMAVSEFLFKELMEFTRAFEIYCLCIIDKHIYAYANDKALRELGIEITEISQNLPILCSNKVSTQEELENEHNSRFPPYRKYTDNAIKQSYERSPMLRELKSSAEAALNAYDDAMKKYEELLVRYNASNLLHVNSNFNYVLSFNYTNTFETLYGSASTEFCYIHGKAQIQKGKTNMIFGIDETLQRGVDNKQFIFAKFKKYFQRIINKTGSEYKDWIKLVNSDISQKQEIYIIGHSLDSTDHEILKEFFDVGKINSNVKITIFYYDELSKVKLIEKTIEMIGKDELIRRVHGSDRNICFVDQYDTESGIMKRSYEAKNPPCEGFCGIFPSFMCRTCLNSAS